ncbi:unnamed protein product [Amoebophrya sp. A120]|nr:unnamed protein product [Amoebophrya sp. A120]|eukprot:GSA120T00001397001.1
MTSTSHSDPRTMIDSAASSSSTTDRWMRVACEQARLGKQSGEVPVGCVFVHEEEPEKPLAKAFNHTNRDHNGTRHCELVCMDAMIADLPEETSFRDVMQKTTLYVTVEPCIMCAGALVLAGVKKVVFGCFNPRFGGCGGVVTVEPPPTGDSATRMEEGERTAAGAGFADTSTTRASGTTLNPAVVVVQEAEAAGAQAQETLTMPVVSSSTRSTTHGDKDHSTNTGPPCPRVDRTLQRLEAVQAKQFEEEAIELLRSFYERGNPNAPEAKRQRKIVEDVADA